MIAEQWVLRARHVGVFAATFVVAWLVYGGNQEHQLLHWDDITYVSANPWITNPSWHFVLEIFTKSRLSNWHPLTWLSYIPEYQLCGDTAACYKATNITLHAFNAFLVFCLSHTVLTLTLPVSSELRSGVFGASLVAALLFAVHPQHVESVIWVAERKDLLCAAFFMLSMIFYLRQHGAATPRSSPLPYLFFALAAMSKSMAVTLPAVLIILDLAPLSRFHGANWKRVFRICVLEKLHFHLTAVLLVLVTLLTQRVDVVEQPAVLERLLISVAALQHYLVTFFLPIDLSPFYPSALVGLQPKIWLLCFAAMLVIGCLAAAVRFGNKFVAWLAYFLVTLAPVIGIVKVGEQAFADRYTYLPMVGFYLLAGIAICSLPFPVRIRRVAAAVLTLALVVSLGVLSREYKEVWRTDLSHWQYINARYTGLSATIHNNLANSYYESRQFRRAVQEDRKAIAIDPARVEIYENMGKGLEALGDRKEALQVYRDAIRRNPRSTRAYIQAGMALERFGNNNGALGLYVRALELEATNTYALFGLGKTALITGDPARSIRPLKGIPGDSLMYLDSQLLLAQAYARTGNLPLALKTLDAIESRYGSIKELALIRSSIN